MGIENSIKEFKIKFLQKNILVINGNVSEIFNKDNEDKNLNQLLLDIIFEYEDGYNKVIQYLPGREKITVTKEEFKEEKYTDKIHDASAPEPITLDNFLQDAYKDIYSDIGKQKCVYIVDAADISLDNQSATIPTQQISALLSSILSIKKTKRELKDPFKNNKIIFITRDSGNLWKLLSNKNIEFTEVQISKPNLEERRSFFEKNSSIFEVSDKAKLAISDPVQEEAVNLTDQFSFREIIQIARISQTLEHEKLTFKELFLLAQFSKRDSEWEKLNNENLKQLKEKLSKRVYGQEEAINAVQTTLIRSKLGFSGFLQNSNMNKPKGVLFFAGPTGVGKTELAKSIAEFVFGDENKLIRFDMSEYNHEHSDQRLIGAPPGYVGYDSGGELTNKVKENPFSILLFDEIEKAHPKILDKFLQILEDGRLTSSKGELINFSETFILFTSNIGQNKTNEKNTNEENIISFKKEITNHFNNKLMRPELLNRIGDKNIIPFNYITSKKIINSIIDSKINKFVEMLKTKYGIILDFENKNDIYELISESSDKKMGGRGIVNSIEENFVDTFTMFLFNNNKLSKNNSDEIIHMICKIEKDKIVFSIK